MKKILIGCGFILAFLSITGFSNSGQKTSNTQSLKSTEEIIYIAHMSYGIHTGVAMTLPLPIKIGQKLHIIIFFYKEGMRPGEEIVYPPHHKIAIGAATGNVIENTPVTPKNLGVTKDPNIATEGFGLDPSMTADEFWSLVDRFFEISPFVWKIYKTGLTRQSNRDLEVIREYNSIFHRIAKAPLIPYYEAVASDFLEWLSKVLQSVDGDSGVGSSSLDPVTGAAARHVNDTRSEVGRSMAAACAMPPIVKRTNLTPEEKKTILMRITGDLDALKGELFLPMFLEKQDLPGNLKMTQDTRRHLPLDPDDDAFLRHCGFCSGLALWEGGFDQTTWRLVDIRYVFPSDIEAQAYLTEQLPTMSEGQPQIPGAPIVGTECKVFGGTFNIRGKPLTHFYYIFRVQNIVVKLYVAQGPDVIGSDKALTPEKVSVLARKCIHRIESYNRAARRKLPGGP